MFVFSLFGDGDEAFSYQIESIQRKHLETLNQNEDLQFYDYSSSRLGGGSSKYANEFDD